MGFHDHHDFEVLNPGDSDLYILKVYNLPYPGMTYNLTLRQKMLLSSNETDMYYSEPSTFTFTTKPTLPYRPPKTNTGAFEVTASYTKGPAITIFWESLKDFEFNGEDFKYDIKVYKNGVRTKLELIESSPFSATYKYKFIRADYKFEIFSKNEIGSSVNSSIVYVDKRALNGVNFVEDVWMVTNNTSTNLTFGLNNEAEDFESFTIFWCSPRYRANPSSCQDSIEFIQVSKEERAHIFHTSNIFNYGVSMNFKDYSSGIVWSSCQVRDDKSLELVKFFKATGEQKRSVRLTWSIDCQIKSLIHGYFLEYCKLDENDDCMGETKNQTLGNKLESYEVNGLKPYTKYGFFMRMFRENNRGLVSYDTVKTSQDGEYLINYFVFFFFF